MHFLQTKRRQWRTNTNTRTYENTNIVVVLLSLLILEKSNALHFASCPFFYFVTPAHSYTHPHTNAFIQHGYIILYSPLLNAAWNGDRFLVRFFLQRQSNRNVRGTQHYTKGIAPPGFQGMTAAQWADQRGFPDIAKLIRLGL